LITQTKCARQEGRGNCTHGQEIKQTQLGNNSKARTECNK
jgi:hypothetical protein